MSATKICRHVHPDGRRCRATPMAKSRFCFWHDPDTSAEADEARRLGGLRRKRERTVASAFDVAGLATSADIRRLYEVAVLDTLSLENSPARNRLLIAAAEGATRLLDTEREEALAASLMEDD
jgi:hypothetical protein